MDWKLPPIIKVYEAYGCIADGRVQLSAFSAQVASSDGSKSYTVTWDGTDHIMCNDNASYWQGYLGYPAIAFLCLKNVLPYDPLVALSLKGIEWKAIAARNKNKWDKVLADIALIARSRGADWEKVVAAVDSTYSSLQFKSFKMLGNKMRPA